jgi:predicted SAM-dependent methyltransferase
MSMRKLHVGGWFGTPGWEVIDVNPGPHVDHVGNAKDLSRFDTATFTDIYASHVLEHFDFKDEIFMTLVEWCRVLVPGGTLHVSVPDMDTLARLFLQREHLSKGDRFAVMRMMFGDHRDQYDYHLVGLNEEFLADLLGKTGFTGIRRVADLGFFDDTSRYAFHGVPVSLNMTAVKS